MSIGIRMLSLVQAKYLWCRSSLFACFVSMSVTLLAEDAQQHVDWAHWRGPTQDGQSYETNLPRVGRSMAKICFGEKKSTRPVRRLS